MRLYRKELGHNPSSTLSFVRKYGPSTRQVIRSMEDGKSHIDPTDSIEREVKDAVETLCRNPSTILVPSGAGSMPRSEGSSVIFVRRPMGDTAFDKVISFIPTLYLLDIFESHCCEVAIKDSLQLFCALSSHALTRTAAGWAHEKSMHRRLGMGGAALRIFQDIHHSTMQPSTRVLPGTLGGLKQAGVSDSFYWMPSVANFQGVDSVLGTPDGQVYTIQATIANDHKDPMKGIQKVWNSFIPEVRTGRTWHYVIVADTKQGATIYMEKFSTKLSSFKLGNTRASVQVWGCVLDSRRSL